MIYCISANSFRGNYFFLNLALFTVTFNLYFINLNSCRGNYSRKYGTYLVPTYLAREIFRTELRGFRAKLGHFIFRAETELTICISIRSKSNSQFLWVFVRQKAFLELDTMIWQDNSIIFKISVHYRAAVRFSNPGVGRIVVDSVLISEHVLNFCKKYHQRV